MKSKTTRRRKTPIKVDDEPKLKPAKAVSYQLRCIWSGKLKILSEKTPSGKEYSFEPGEVKTISNTDDALYLLSLKRTATGCCTSSGTEERHYFEVV